MQPVYRQHSTNKTSTKNSQYLAHLPMKTYKKTATSKLFARFDNELRDLLMADLKALKERGQFTTRNNQATQQAA